MTLKEKFKSDLHDGENINGMIRFNGYHLQQNDDKSQSFLFDNGNYYTINPEGVIIERIDAEDEFFIDKQIARRIKAFLNSIPQITKKYEIRIYADDNCVEGSLISKDEKKDHSILIAMVINRISKNIKISNIFIPPEITHNGFGKKIILETYKIALKHSYRLFLVEMVEGFYNRMIKRGAEMIEPYDIVEITENTKLE